MRPLETDRATKSIYSMVIFGSLSVVSVLQNFISYPPKYMMDDAESRFCPHYSACRWFTHLHFVNFHLLHAVHTFWVFFNLYVHVTLIDSDLGWLYECNWLTQAGGPYCVYLHIIANLIAYVLCRWVGGCGYACLCV